MDSIFDHEDAIGRLGGDRRLLREVGEIFVAEASGMLEAIAGALAGGDPKAVFQVVHRMKGSVANFSARRAVEAALRLEEIAAAGTLQGAGEAFASLEIEVGRFREALVAFLAGEAGDVGGDRGPGPAGLAPRG